MPSIAVKGADITVLADGRLANVSDWSPDVAEALAEQEGLKLTNAHWDLITLMRGYYTNNNISPIRKLLKKEIVRNLGKELATDDYLMSLFPGGVQYQGTKIAGIPVPQLDSELDRSVHVKAAAELPQVEYYNSEFEYNGRKIDVYPSGNLVHMDDWSEELAAHMAEKEGITLTEDHWVVLRYLRKFYFEYGITPMVKILIKHIGEELGPEVGDRDGLYALFPKGPSRQGSRIAGLPMPQGCIDG